MKRNIIISIFLLGILVIITGCNAETIKSEPEISVKFNISNLTDEEFQYIGTKGLDNPTKDDFKNVEFTLDEKNTNAISNRKITIPDLKAVVNSYDKNRYWFGESGIDDITMNKYAQYDYKFVFYSNELNEQDIKNIFNTCEVRVSWTTSNGKNEEKIIKLGDVIQFKS